MNRESRCLIEWDCRQLVINFYMFLDEKKYKIQSFNNPLDGLEYLQKNNGFGNQTQDQNQK